MMWGNMMDGQAYGWMGLGMIGVILFWILVIAFIIVLILALVKRLTGSSGLLSKQPQEKTALDLLKERYARGEIDRHEFEQKKSDLGN